MAGAYLTIGAKYRPFSYEELIRPVAMATEAHNKIDEQYADLQSKAGVWENLANKETDPESYKKYKDYSDSLKAQAEDLAKNGLNTQSMRDMLNLRARYSSDIVPLEQAYTRRRQLADEQRKMIMQNPTLKFQRDMSTTSLDDFVNNPELDYGYSVNGAMIAKQASEAYSHLAKSIQQEPQYKHILNNNYYQSMLRSGYTPEQILALARNDSSAPAELRQISQQIYDSTGVEDFIKNAYPNAGTNENEALQAQEWRDYVNSYINQGAWGAVGTTSYGTVVDQDAAHRKQMDLIQARAKQKGSSSSGAGGVSTPRRDQTIIMSSGKGTMTSKPMGNISITKGDSDDILNKIASQTGFFARKGGLVTVSGIDKNGNLETNGLMKHKEFMNSMDKMTVTNLRIDYDSGKIIADILVNDGKNSEQIRASLDPEIIGSDKGVASMHTGSEGIRAIAEAKSTGKRVPLRINGRDTGVSFEYKDGIVYEYDNGVIADVSSEDDAIAYFKDIMYAATRGSLNYVGSLNTNTSTGMKMEDAGDVSNVSAPSILDLE